MHCLAGKALGLCLCAHFSTQKGPFFLQIQAFLDCGGGSQGFMFILFTAYLPGFTKGHRRLLGKPTAWGSVIFFSVFAKSLDI